VKDNTSGLKLKKQQLDLVRGSDNQQGTGEFGWTRHRDIKPAAT